MIKEYISMINGKELKDCTKEELIYAIELDADNRRGIQRVSDRILEEENKALKEENKKLWTAIGVK